MLPTDETRTLIDDLLAEQRQLMPVERFAQWHCDPDSSAPAGQYRSLIPLGKPLPGEQYAFAVDLDRCTGCKACVSACHSLNGLDENETWRGTGLLQGGTAAEPYQQIVTSACHHCIDPACLNGCPVLAYEKDSSTGIVRHLDDQCIGCQYCVLKCPYDVPKYSAQRGIVRKCDLCHSRLASGEAPACAQACPTSAISIRLVNQELTSLSCSQPNERLLPGTFASSYTIPTTIYLSRRAVPTNAQPADHNQLRLEEAHWPLIWMLLLTQLGAGGFLTAGLLTVVAPHGTASGQGTLVLASFLALHAGLAASFFHLGRPWGAWRAFLGWRRSWMSREIIAFGCFATAATALSAATFLAPGSVMSSLLLGLTVFLALVSVLCSAMIYVDTRRVFWRASSTLVRFVGATVLLGPSGAAAALGWTEVLTGNDLGAVIHPTAWAAILLRAALFLREAQTFIGALKNPGDPNHDSALVIWQLRKPLLIGQALLFMIATAFGLLAFLATGPVGALWASVSFAATFGAQLIERYSFFVAVRAPRMPGGVPA